MYINMKVIKEKGSAEIPRKKNKWNYANKNRKKYLGVETAVNWDYISEGNSDLTWWKCDVAAAKDTDK